MGAKLSGHASTIGQVAHQMNRQPRRSAMRRPARQGWDPVSQAAVAALLDPRAVPPRARVRPVRIARKAGWKLRRQLAPLLVMAATWGAGTAAHAAVHGLTVVLIGAAVASAGVWLFTRRWLDEPRERVYTIVVLAGVMAWLVTATLCGAGPPMPAVLWGGGAGLALPWWWRHRYRPTLEEAGDSSAEQTWAERVAAQGKALPGSRLDDIRKIRAGWRGRIRLLAGDQSTDDAVAATARIASAYEKPAAQVIVEATEEGVASHAQLTVLDRNPLRATRFWAQPTFDPATGAFDLGVYADAGIARFEFLAPGSGAQHALVAGTTGSGKTNTVSTILTEAHLSRQVVVWLVDPQLGQSLPAWNQHTDWTALGTEQAMSALRAFKRVMMARSARMATLDWTDAKGRVRNGKDHYTLDPFMPLHYLVIEEAHHLLLDPIYGPEAVKLLEDAGKMGRKTGSGICLVTQLPSLDQLGGSQTLRAMLSSGNVIVHRTSDKVTGNMAFSGALPVEPHKLPRRFPDGSATHGLGYLLGSAARQAAMRTWLVDDPYGVATSLPPLTLEPDSAAAAGEVYAHRHDQDPAAHTVTDETGDDTDIPERTQQEREPLLADRLHTILTERGETNRGDLIAATHASPRGVTNALNDLITEGRAERTGHGRYRALYDEPAG